MEDQTLEKNEFSVGDLVIVNDTGFSSEPRAMTAKVIDVRCVLGMTSYVVEGDGGKRKVVSPKQIRKSTKIE